MEEIAPYGHPDFEPKLAGRNITVMVSPLPRNKRARNPNAAESAAPPPGQARAAKNDRPVPAESESPAASPAPAKPKPGAFVNNPFAQLEAKG
jgi:hypothetical protein